MPYIFNYTVILSVSSCLENHTGIFCTVLSVVGNINSSTPSGSPQTLHRFDKGVFLCNLPWCGNKFPKHFVLFSRMVLYLLINFHMFCGHHCICDFQLKVHLCDFHSHKFSIAKINVCGLTHYLSTYIAKWSVFYDIVFKYNFHLNQLFTFSGGFYHFIRQMMIPQGA